MALALAALAGGFGQFGAVAALGDVAKSFGQVTHGATVAEQAGLSGTVLGVGLAIIRLASLGGIAVAGLADRFGRRRLLVTTLVAGLGLTALAAASPGYWWFVVSFSLGRPLLSGADVLAQVTAAEHTGKDDRAKAVALVAAGYGVGAGLTAIVHSIGLGSLGFRGLFALSLVPLAALGLLRRRIYEPERFSIADDAERSMPVLGAIAPRFRRRLAVVLALAFTLSVITGPATGFVFLYAQNIIRQTGYVTALMVVGAGASGLVGLVIGQRLADRWGRRPTASIGMVGVAICGVIAYSGSGEALVAGYVAGVLCGSVLAPAIGAIVNELFPTSVRASVSGWFVAAGVVGAALGLVIFGAVADVRNQFALAATVTFLPAAAAAILFFLLPETRGRELEEIDLPN